MIARDKRGYALSSSSFCPLLTPVTTSNCVDLSLFQIPGVPYQLKQYIDVLSMPGTLFGFEPSKGYIGLLEGKRATIVSTAAIYMPGLSKAYGTDHVTPFLTDWLRFAGVEAVTSVWHYGSKMRGDGAEATTAFDEALAAARAAGAK